MAGRTKLNKSSSFKKEGGAKVLFGSWFRQARAKLVIPTLPQTASGASLRMPSQPFTEGLGCPLPAEFPSSFPRPVLSSCPQLLGDSLNVTLTVLSRSWQVLGDAKSPAASPGTTTRLGSENFRAGALCSQDLVPTPQ